MCSILEDSRLVQLQQEGGASLSWLRSVSVTEDERVALGSVSALYDQVDELLHRLVTLSNCRTQELSFIMDFSSVEQGFGEVSLSMLTAQRSRVSCHDLHCLIHLCQMKASPVHLAHQLSCSLFWRLLCSGDVMAPGGRRGSSEASGST